MKDSDAYKVEYWKCNCGFTFSFEENFVNHVRITHGDTEFNRRPSAPQSLPLHPANPGRKRT